MILEKINPQKEDKDINLIIELKKIIENHIFIEEKFIFKTSEKDINKLITEHKEIFWLLKKEDFKELNKLLINHANLEIKEFYPKLDLKLNEREKCSIINEMKSCRAYL